MSDGILARGGRRAAMLVGLAAVLVLLTAPWAVASGPSATSSNPADNEAGRLDTSSLYDLGGRTSALYVFVTDASGCSRQLFWKSAKGKFDARKSKLAAGDLNADGRTDALVLYDRGKGKSTLYAFLSNGTKYVKTTAWSGSLAWGKATLCSGDVNGDGATDAYVLSQAGAGRSAVSVFVSQVKPADGGGLAGVSMAKTVAWPAGPYEWKGTQAAVTDVNADGKDDLVGLSRVSSVEMRLDAFVSDGAALSRTTWWQGEYNLSRATLACGDVDSDGNGDALALVDAGDHGSAVLVFRSDGRGFGTGTSWWRSGDGMLEWSGARLACGDLTGDGRSDVVILGAEGASRARLTVAVSDGTRLAAQSLWAGAYAVGKAKLACAASVPTVVPESTEVLDPEVVADAQALDDSTYEFANARQTAGLSPGDVIIGEPTASLPSGIMAKVTEVDDAVVSVEPASLEDAVSCGEFSVEHAITEDDFASTSTSTPGVTLVRSRRGAGDSRLLTFRFRNVDVSKEWEIGSDLGPVTLNGSITLRITMRVEGKVSWGEVKSFSASETTTVSSDLRASVTRDWEISSERTLVTWGAGQLLGFTVWVGPVPLYFQPELSIFVGANGKFTAGVETGIHHEISGSLGLSYRPGTFSAWTAMKIESSYTPPTLFAAGSVKAYAGAQLGLELYAMAGPYIRTDGYLKLEADTRATPWWKLKAGLEASMGAQIGVDFAFIHWNKDWRSGDLRLAEWTLAQASTAYKPAGAVTGRVQDGYGEPLGGVAIAASQGGTSRGGTTSAADGSFSLVVSPGADYRLSFSKAGYSSDSRTGITVVEGQVEYIGAVSLVDLPAAGETRIVLTWGEQPQDLDSHLVGPSVYGGLFHVFYSQRDAVGDANLDHDDTSGYGPETTTILAQREGVYRFGVHDFTNRGSGWSDALASSGAQVRVYQSQGLVGVFTVPSGVPGTLWTVFELSGSTLTPVDAMSYVSDPASVLMPYGSLPVGAPTAGTAKQSGE